jgi:hypothetical protein
MSIVLSEKVSTRFERWFLVQQAALLNVLIQLDELATLTLFHPILRLNLI